MDAVFSPSVDIKRLRYVLFAYGTVGAVYTAQAARHLDVRAADAQLPEWVALLAHAVWVAALVLMVAKPESRAFRVAHFAAAAVALQFEPLVGSVAQSVEVDMYMFPAFWLMFLRIPHQSKDSVAVSGWPLVMLGVTLALFLSSAGIHKLWDPLWRQGVGFFYVVELPWIKPDLLKGLSRWPGMEVVNWTTIALELAALPLFVWPRTRTIGAVLIGLFFAALIFPLRLDFIGQFGVVSASFLLTISTSRTPVPLVRRAPVALTTAALVGAFLATLTPSVFYGPWQQIPLLSEMNRLTVRQAPVALFTARHTVGVYGYRVIHVLEDGRIVEPLRVFDPDGTGGADSVGLLSPRFLQSAMYPITGYAHRRSYGEPVDLPVAAQGVIRLSEKRAGDQVAITLLLVAPLEPSSPCSSPVDPTVQWAVVYRSDDVLVDPPPRFTVQARVGGLPNFGIDPHPDCTGR